MTRKEGNSSSPRSKEDMEPLWNVEAAAQYLGVTRHWVYRRCADGTLPHKKIGNRTRLIPAEVRAWAAKQGPGVDE